MSTTGPQGDDEPLTEADIERMLRALGPDAPQDGPDRPGVPDGTDGPGTDAPGTDGPEHGRAASAGPGPAASGDAPAGAAAQQTPARLALVLTPVASAPALAGLCAMAGIDVDVVPSASGAVAVLEVPAKEAPADWDITELLGGGEMPGAFPPEAEEVASALSRLARTGVVLLTADLATDVGIEPGLSGHVSARRYVGGTAEGDMPAGLVLAGADQVVEDLVLGRVRAGEVAGHQRSGNLPRWKATRMFTRGLRRRKP